MKLTITNGVDKDDISGGYYDNIELSFGLPTRIPVDNPRFQAALAFFGALFPSITEAVLIPEDGPGRAVAFPASISFLTASGPIPELIGATETVFQTDVTALDIRRALNSTAPLPLFLAWWASTKLPTPVLPTSWLGPKEDSVSEIWKTDVFSFAAPADIWAAAKDGDEQTIGGVKYTVRTLAHPFGLRKFLVRKG